MLFVNNKASVQIETVEEFQKKVKNFTDDGMRITEDLLNTLTEMQEEICAKAEKLEGLVQEYEMLYAQVKNDRGRVAENVASMRAELSSIPKTVKETVKDGKGNEKVREKSNPMHEQAQARLKKENSLLYELGELSYKIYDKKHYIGTLADRVKSDAAELDKLRAEFKRSASRMIAKSDAAYRSLERCLRIIYEYKIFSFR